MARGGTARGRRECARPKFRSSVLVPFVPAQPAGGPPTGQALAREFWRRFVDAQPRRPHRLPFLIPVLMTQYPARNTPTRLSAILDLPDRVRETFGAPFDVQLFVDDLTGSVLDDPVADPADLALVEIARTVLYAYKNPHALDDPRLATLGPLFDTVLDHFGPEEIEEILSYVVHALGEGSPIFGRVEGRAMAKAESLLQVLGHRMGSIPSATRERVLATSDEQLLERWFDRALTAGSVEEVFDWLDA